MRSAKSGKRYLLYIPAVFALMGGYVGAWLSLADPESVGQYSISGALVGLIAGALLAMMAKSSSSAEETPGDQEEAKSQIAELERKKAFRYQKFDFANSSLQTAFAILLVAVAYSVLTSIHHRSPFFLFFVIYPSIMIASRLVYLSWGWFGRIIILAGWPILYVVTGIWLMISAPTGEAGLGLVIIGLGLYTASQSLQRFRKVRTLIAKYPLESKEFPKGV